MADSLGNKKFLRFYPLISGLILLLSFEDFPGAWVFALIGLMPFFAGLFQEKTLRAAFLRSWLAGFIFYSFVIRWFLAAYPVEWAGVIDEDVALLLVLFVWIGSAAVLALSFALFGISAWRLDRDRIVRPQRIWAYILILPSFWILSQYAAAWIFVFWSYGSGASLGPHWTLGNIGYALVDTPFIYWSRLAGLYGVSFLAASANVLFFLLYGEWKKSGRALFYDSTRRWSALFAGGITILLILLLPWGATILKGGKDGGRPLRAAVLQTHFSGGPLYHRTFAELYRASAEDGLIREQPDIIVFPEDSQFFSFMGEEEKALLDMIFPDKSHPGLIITSATLPVSSGGRKKFVYYRNERGELISRQEKSFLIPTGEFMPSLLRLIIFSSGSEEIDKMFSGQRALLKGDRIEEPLAFGDTSVGTILCSGAISPPLYNSLSKAGAEILINSASHAVFKGDPYFLRQIELMVRFQAIANEKPFIQASNGGLSFVLDPDGKIVTEGASLGNLLLAADVVPHSSKNPYVRFGDWPILLSGLGLAAVFGRRLRRK